MSATSSSPRLDRLHLVPHARRFHHHNRIGNTCDFDFRLTRAHRLEQDAVETGGVQQQQRIRARFGQPARAAARRHRTDEDACVTAVPRHAHAVPQQARRR